MKSKSPSAGSPSNADHQPSEVWIVIAAYNEAGRIDQTLSSLHSTRHNIIVVDDGSSDPTRELAAKHPVWTLRHPINCGQGATLQTGIDFAVSRGATAIVTFDADGQHDPADLPAMLQPIIEDACDVVLGSRFLGQTVDMPPLRRWILALATWFTRRTSGLRVTDTHNGFRVFSRKAATSIRI